MFVSVGSAATSPRAWASSTRPHCEKWQQEKPLGATWGDETDRADVLVFDPQGKNRASTPPASATASAWRSIPTTGDVWCSTNERDASATISSPTTSRA